MLHIQQNVRLVRKAAGMTQKEFAEKIGATEAIIKSYEGKKGIVPDEFMLARISRLSGVDKDSLLNKPLTEADLTRYPTGVDKVEMLARETGGSDPLRIIASLVEQTSILTRNNEKLVNTNESLVTKTLLSLNEILRVSGLSSEVSIDRRRGVQQGATSGKSGTHSVLKKGKQKGIVQPVGR